jgi:hypothetical protein
MSEDTQVSDAIKEFLSLRLLARCIFATFYGTASYGFYVERLRSDDAIPVDSVVLR